MNKALFRLTINLFRKELYGEGKEILSANTRSPRRRYKANEDK